MDAGLRRPTLLFLSMLWIFLSGRALVGTGHLPSLQEETPTVEQEGPSTPGASAPSPAEIIEAINSLRTLNGLNALTVHPVLMDVAAQQASALAASGGTIGHQRPCGMTLGQELLWRGFALWGDLSQDGYRSENWGIAGSAARIVASWLGDELHANTMLSPNRSHIGAAVAVSDQVYIVLETALQTGSGKMQSTAYDILTGIPATQAACIGLSTQDALYADLSQYSIPVVMSTARPDGDVIHEVKYGQSLWSIAVQYSTTIEQIRRLNNLTSDTIVPGWTLLIQKGATRPAPLAASATFQPAGHEARTPPHQPISTPTLSNPTPSVQPGQWARENSVVVVAFLISFSVLVAAMTGLRKKPE